MAYYIKHAPKQKNGKPHLDTDIRQGTAEYLHLVHRGWVDYFDMDQVEAHLFLKHGARNQGADPDPPTFDTQDLITIQLALTISIGKTLEVTPTKDLKFSSIRQLEELKERVDICVYKTLYPETYKVPPRQECRGDHYWFNRQGGTCPDCKVNFPRPERSGGW